jgi:anti-sigma regulatory factor (Ser/Thr protein kinase)
MTSARREHLRPIPASVPRARSVVTEALTAAGVPPGPIDRARLVTSELVTNAVLHGDGDVELRVDVGPGRFRITVADEAPSEPHPVDVEPGAVSGRGLRLVERMADAWGTAPREDRAPGKAIWAEVRWGGSPGSPP